MDIGERLSNQVEVRNLEEGVDCRWFVRLSSHPIADIPQGDKDLGIRWEKELVAAFIRPFGEFIVPGFELVLDFFDAEHSAPHVGLDEPVPEAGTEVETVVQVLGTDEDIGVEEIGHLPSHFQACRETAEGR